MEMIQIDMPMPDNAETIDVACVIQALKESYQKFSENSDMFVDKAGYKYALIDPNLILDSIALLKTQNLTVEPKLLELEDETKAWLDEMDAVDALGNIANICIDWDGYRTANGLGELVNEIWAYARYCADRLAKAQEPVVVQKKPIEMFGLQTWMLACGKCGKSLMYSVDYCPWCGKAVKWE